jgi:hypothetical protein
MSHRWVAPLRELGRWQVAISALVVAATLALSACNTPPKACTAIGALAGISITLDAGLIAPGSPATLTACVDDTCQTQVFSDPRTGPLFVGAAPVQRAAKVNVSVSVNRGGVQVFRATTTAPTIKYQPNGPGCPPTVWGVNVTAHASGELTS